MIKGQITGIQKSQDPVEVNIGFYKYSDFNIGHLKYLVLDNDTTIRLDYYNQKYPTLKDLKFIYFKGGAKEVNDLYSIMLSFYSEENKDNKEMRVDFKLGKTDVSISRVKSLLMVWTEEGYFTLNKSNVNSLFTVKR